MTTDRILIDAAAFLGELLNMLMADVVVTISLFIAWLFVELRAATLGALGGKARKQARKAAKGRWKRAAQRQGGQHLGLRRGYLE
ncbi:hypothetical protein QIH93_20880 [Bradyrhizobium ottawaense]|uniref:hypothetical protein n=1 Tax=Bradyrhizobium ottawaense TaxID=931866 RepID=UPI002715502C|nr:hypothetical protein [Bradyrhizobium ottawaense]WLB43004.1 hypothetical protein QIH93_20880 [Bradyrhizobium ottawaense]